MNREMIDSGVEWIGEIPSTWNTSRIGAEYKVRNEKVSDKDYMPLSVTKLTEGIVPQMDQVAKSDAHDDRKLVLKGDFVINSRSDRKMSCGVSNYDGSVSLINTVLQPIGEITSNFTHYLLKNYSFAEEFYKWGHGIVADLWTTNADDLKRITIPFPSVEEQQKIVETLGKKISQIDKLITNQEKQIEKIKEYKQSLITKVVTKGLNPNVEMIDSNVDWIGKIPSNYKMTPMKYLGEIRNGLTYSPSDMTSEDEGRLVLRSSNIQNGKLIFEDNVYVNCDVKEELIVRKNDILICSRNGSRKLIGKNALIYEDYDFSFGAFMMIFRTTKNAKYIYYILNSNVFAYYLGTYLTSTINQLTGSNFNSMIVPYCYDTKEQTKIVEYLDKKCSSFDKIIEIKKSKIEELQDYKKSIIYEYVTGKKEVC